MDESIYKIIHMSGLFLTFAAIGGIAASAQLAPDSKPGIRKFFSAMHGIGLLVVIAAGFGLMAKTKVEGMPTWIVAKLAIWLFLGGITALIAKMRSMAALWVCLAVAAGACSAWLAIAKPF